MLVVEVLPVIVLPNIRKNMNKFFKTFYCLLLMSSFFNNSFSQNIIQEYHPLKKDSIRIGKGEKDFLKYIQKGYILSLPKKKQILGTLIFLEGSGFDKKNKSAKLVYKQANKKGFAILSVSTEIPLDFYFTDNSSQTAHQIIEKVFKEHNLPNYNIFLIGAGLSGHRAMKYVEYIKKSNPLFKLNLIGMVICDSALDWVRQYNEGARDIRIKFNEGSIWEGTFSTYLLNENLKGTPKSNLENYLDFSSYSYFDEKSRHIKYFKDLAIRTYMQVAIEYWLEEKRKTPIDNNGSDMVGLIAELKLIGNNKSELKVIYPNDSKSEKKNVDGTWISVDKKELIKWILKRSV
ncbi:MAG: hypothetical protein ABJJ05_09255 [Maribacter litoralis]|uniref:hypothetical protein n=1 Tax=Maribacter litoralis TaxID=2059726 RepID=UPI003297B008